MRHVIALCCLGLVFSVSSATAANLVETFTDAPAMTIPDRPAWDSPVGEAIGTMNIDFPRVIGGVRVHLNLTTATSSDLRIWVESPEGTAVELLFIGSGGEPGTNPVGWYPTDFTPREDMDQWIGETVSGDWTIICQDWSEGGGDSVLNSWSVEITYDDVVDTESVTFGEVKAQYR